MAAAESEVRTLRSFNRTVTAAMGVLDEGLLQTEFVLSEARTIHDLAQRDATEVSDLRERLGLDSGYLSRLLSRLEERDLVRREVSPADGRRQVASLTPAGRDAFAVLDSRADHEAARLLDALGDRDRLRLVSGMRAVRDILAGPPASRAVVLRAAGPGDWGWIVSRHGALYAAEYGWDESFEALVARIVADHIESRDPRTDAAWIAELDGEPAGCVLCVREDERTAKLRLLLVDPRARGLGIGGRLVEECIRFARRAGYARLVLWTNAPLTSARRIYEAAGFVLTGEEEHESFGSTLTGQTFSLEL
jgi:DNA-binding MarR family transcriptional regulator/GNAT superfamily N-acetyltransferase